MHRLVRTLVACAIILFPLVSRAAGPAEPATFAHIRCVNSTTRDLLRDGTRRSETLRRLAEEIEQSDVIVYIETRPTLDVPVSAHLQMAGATPVARYLRILVKIPAGADNAIALLGHELQHAREIAHATAVHDQRSLETLYKQIGDENDSGWETKAARLVAYIIRDELRGKNAQ